MTNHNTTAPVTLFKKQERIYPRQVKGTYRTLKWAAMILCLAVYYLVPFIRWDRGPNAPDQAVLIDLARGRAYWFWFEIWPQEVYILTGILICAAIGLFFVTSLFGRVWCGYLCFQTVWTDLFVAVERMVFGDRNKRKKIVEGPWTREKIFKTAVTHVLWLGIAWCTAGSFVLYFNDAPTLVRSFLNFSVSPTVLVFIAGLTFMTYLMAGYAREQVCTFMCPYARFQSAMFDKDTLIIGYDVHRGEPRGSHKKGQSWDNRGHCIDCTACVQVCPMGIDIRNGLQMECIACGLCIDACDDIMVKLDLPKGLIRYDNERRMEEKAQGKFSALHLIRPRTFYYAGVLLVVFSLMLYALLTRPAVDLNILHDRNPLFTRLSDGQMRNGYDIKILNKTHQDHFYTLSVKGLENASVKTLITDPEDTPAFAVAADSVAQYKIFIQAPVEPAPPRNITVTIREKDTGLTARYETMFISQRP